MSNLKKIVALVLAMALVMTMFASAAIKTDLSKYVDGESFTEAQKDALALVNAVGIINGVGENEIGTASLTRAQLAVVLYAMKNGTTDGAAKYGAPVFTDVPATHWAAGYVSWAALTDVVKGVSATSYAPDTKVTPIQAAAMIARIFDPSACQDPATFAQDAQVAAVKYGLLNGITTPNFFAQSEISRGDMFIMLANALVYNYAKDTNLLTAVFGVEKIEGAILLGAEKTYYRDPYGKNADLAYSVFAFRTETAGDVTYFATDLLCVEDDPTVDDIGCKYVIYVSKTASYNGFRTLYAAYEMDGDKYYNVTSGTVGDGKLVFAGDKQNVFFDIAAVVYVDGKTGYTVDDFQKIYAEQKNTATYKLIDNDGDGKIEYAFIVRLSYADLGVTTVTAKVTAVNANGQITLTTADGTVYADLVYGNYYNKGVLTSNEAAIKATLGIAQPTYFPFTAISDVYYDFDIVAGFVFNVAVSEKTAFAGNYGLFITWSTPLTMYKNMPYGLFMNENNEYFWAYVSNVNDIWNFIPNNGVYDPLQPSDLICFVDGDYSDDVISFYTADYWNENQTYNWLEAFEWELEVGSDLSVTFPKNVISEIMAKETVNYTDLVDFGDIYAVFSEDTAVGSLSFWDQRNQEYVALNPAKVLTLVDRALDGTPALNYKQLEDKKFYPISNSKQFYGIEDLDECLGFVIRTDAKIDVTVDLDTYDGESFQIYKANGFWHLRFYTDVPNLGQQPTTNNVTITWNGYELKQKSNGQWCIGLGDGNDPQANANPAEWIYMGEIIKGFVDADFTLEVQQKINDLVAEYSNKTVMSKRTLLNVDKGVIFAYGNVVAPVRNGGTIDPALLRWVAFDASTFNKKNFGLTKENATDIPNVHDELVYTVIGGTTYVKAMKVTSELTDILPYGWIKNAGYEVVIFNGLTGAVNTNGWQIDMITVTSEGVKSEKVYTKIGIGNAVVGEILLVKRDADGSIVELIDVGGGYDSYLKYVGGSEIGIINGVLTSATTIEVTDEMEDYNIQKLSGVIVYAVIKDGKYVTTTAYDKAWNGKTVTAYSISGCTVVLIG